MPFSRPPFQSRSKQDPNFSPQAIRLGGKLRKVAWTIEIFAILLCLFSYLTYENTSSLYHLERSKWRKATTYYGELSQFVITSESTWMNKKSGGLEWAGNVKGHRKFREFGNETGRYITGLGASHGKLYIASQNKIFSIDEDAKGEISEALTLPRGAFSFLAALGNNAFAVTNEGKAYSLLGSKWSEFSLPPGHIQDVAVSLSGVEWLVAGKDIAKGTFSFWCRTDEWREVYSGGGYQSSLGALGNFFFILINDRVHALDCKSSTGTSLMPIEKKEVLERPFVSQVSSAEGDKIYFIRGNELFKISLAEMITKVRDLPPDTAQIRKGFPVAIVPPDDLIYADNAYKSGQAYRMYVFTGILLLFGAFLELRFRQPKVKVTGREDSIVSGSVKLVDGYLHGRNLLRYFFLLVILVFFPLSKILEFTISLQSRGRIFFVEFLVSAVIAAFLMRLPRKWIMSPADIGNFELALKRNAKFKMWSLGLIHNYEGEILRLSGQLEKAWRFFKNRENPVDKVGYAETLIQEALVLLWEGQFSTAERVSRKAIDLYPALEGHYLILCHSLLEQEDTQAEAIKCFHQGMKEQREAIWWNPVSKLFPKQFSKGLIAALGAWTMQSSGYPEEAQRYLKSALRSAKRRSFSDSAMTHYLLGRFYLTSGDRGQALAFMKKGVECDPQGGAGKFIAMRVRELLR